MRRAPFPSAHAADSARSANSATSAEDTPPAKIYLVFGREDSGLSNEDLQMMNGTMTFPTWGYPSMSLSHAVTTGALLFCLAREAGLPPSAHTDPLANRETFDPITQNSETSPAHE